MHQFTEYQAHAARTALDEGLKVVAALAPHLSEARQERLPHRRLPSTTRRWIRPRMVPALLAVLLLSGCGGGGGSSDDRAASGGRTTANAATISPTSASRAEPVTANAGPSSDAPVTVPSQAWKEQVSAVCAEAVATFASNPRPGLDADAASYGEFAKRARATMGEAVGITAIPGIPSDLAAVVGQREAGIDSAVTAIAQAADDGDAAAARRGVDALDFHLSGIATAAARADATCASAEPARVEAADVNAWLEFPPIAGSAGFGSIWIAENRGDRVARLDTLTGEPIATVDVGPGPAIGQPADGYMWMRTDSDIVAIDPRTNAVAARLSKAEVGPEANRFRALDGALWICDGPRLHRYDPTTLTRLATIELGIHCGNVTATPDLVVVFPFRDETPPVAAFVDPATNQVVGQVPLPMPVLFATVQPDTVFFAGFDTAQAAVVDRASWAVTETPDLGRPTVGGTLATDGTSIYVPAASSREVLVIDAATFAVVDTIDPLEPWSVVFADGGLWVVPDNGAIAQRFER